MCKKPPLFWSKSVTPLRPPTASQWAAVRITTEACRRSNPHGVIPVQNAPLANRSYDVRTDRCNQTIFEGHTSDIVFANNNIIFVTHIEPVKNYTTML